MKTSLKVLVGVAAVSAVAGCCRPQNNGRYDGAAARIAPRHVIMVGFDGLAASAVTNAATPAMHRMMREGAGTLRSRSVLPSASAVNWHSFFTCSASEQHGYVAWNSKEPKFPAMETTARGLYPDLFSEFRRIRSEAEIGLFYEWDGIVHTLDTNACSMVAKANTGEDSVKRMCGYIVEKKPAFLAICLDEPDHAGHSFGWGSTNYLASVERLDAILARILDAVQAAGIADETVVMLFSDHGGLNKGHGGPTLAEMERPTFFLGKGVRKGHVFDRPGTIYDDGATLAALLGIVRPPASWIGRPRHDAFEDTLAPARPALVPLPRDVVWGTGRCPADAPEKATRDASLRPEGYVLEIDGKKGIVLRYADEAGLFYAHVTLGQLRQGDSYPDVRIIDWPEFAFRSVLIDDARLCYGKASLRKIIDQMAGVKLNVLHWHFIEPGAWRMEVPGYPKLTERLPDGMRYSRADMKEIVDYAAARHVRVVPEVEMPGHNDVTRQYPELGHGTEKPFGDVCPTNPKTIAFFKAALTEASAQFPDAMVHFGGDEVGYGNWKKCSRCQAKIRELGLQNEADLQAWFMGEMAAHLKSLGKTPIGWSDMLLSLEDNMRQNAKGFWTGYGIRRNLPKDIVINAWYGDWECAGGSGAVSANLGYKVIQYPSNHCYFDHTQGLPGDRHAYAYKTVLGLREAYDFDPRCDVRPECRKNVVGVGCANWSEKATDLKALEWKLWPRGFGTAEVGWTGPDRRNYDDFVPRARALADIYRKRGVNAATYH